MTTKPHVEGLSPVLCEMIADWPGTLKIQVRENHYVIVGLSIGYAHVNACEETIQRTFWHLDDALHTLIHGARWSQSILEAVKESR